MKKKSWNIFYFCQKRKDSFKTEIRACKDKLRGGLCPDPFI